MQTERMQSETIGKLAAALSKAQAKISVAKKDSKNPFFNSSYADLSSVWEACRGALSENELCVIQTLKECDDKTAVITTLAHSSGEFISSLLFISPKNKDSQSVGSAITYARRYSLSAIVGVSPDDDDDGEKSMGRNNGDKNKPSANNSAPKPTAAPDKKWPHPAASQTTLITMQERQTIFKLLKEKGIESEAFKAWLIQEYGIDKTDDIRGVDYPKVYEWIIRNAKEVAAEVKS